MKVYIVVGICTPYDEGSYMMVSKHAVKSTLEKAQEEFLNILNEIKEDAEKNEYTYSASFDRDRLMMVVNFGSGTEEIYRIYENEIDF